MSEISSPLLKALDEIWSALEVMGLPMAVTGGLSLSVWNHPRSTHDVDILIAIDESRIEELLAALVSAGARFKRKPAVTKLDGVDVVQVLYEPRETYLEIQVDVLIARSEFYSDVLERCISVTVENIELQVVSCEDLILLKLLAGRIIDQADTVALILANSDDLDLEYLVRCADEQNVEEEFKRTWNEALPGSPLT
ncbi:MAG: nucleotidyl transferase AbiEii/AbiGii toxin family protein [Planctomycetota bacterium]|nr:nucleotidyl transferase AbiEii/AbiGii toxin family protein [Planctomycetota bacterium]MDA1139980.1 nucleotidyl transferase AbiEii/AbiGii toxin family protein [Planctomycetota bacterium]